MDIKNLEALSQLKKQMKEETKKKNNSNQPPKSENAQEQNNTDIEKQKARDEHRAELKAAKKKFKESSSTKGGAIQLSDEQIEDLRDSMFISLFGKFHDKKRHKEENNIIISQDQCEQPCLDIHAEQEEKKQDIHTSQKENTKSMIDSKRKAEDELLRAKAKAWQEKRDAELAEQRRYFDRTEEYTNPFDIFDSKKTEPHNTEESQEKKEEQRKQQEMDQLRAKYQQLCRKANDINAKANHAEVQVEVCAKNITLHDTKIKQKQIEIERERSGINSNTGDPVVDKIKVISLDINRHRNLEQSKYIRIPAISRVNSKYDGVFWLTNCEANPQYGGPLTTDGTVYSKNSSVGLEVIKFFYDTLGSSKYNDAAQWANYSSGVRELVFKLSGYPQKYEYQSLRVLLDKLGADDYKLRLLDRERLLLIRDRDVLVKEAERYRNIAKSAKADKERLDREIKELKDKLDKAEESFDRKKAEEEKFRLEEEERLKAEEEKLRLEEEERLRKEAEEKELENQKIEQEIAELNKSIEEQKEKVRIARSFIREENILRSQHLLDPNQEEAKRSHFFDGVPCVIEGGPGTGKTTTIIQRLKFLLSPEAFRENKNPLSKAQREELLNPNTMDLMWLFISPTKQLLHYLRNNMVAEGLRATERNTKTIGKFRSDIFSEYKLSGTFKIIDYRNADEYEPLILKPKEAIRSFEDFIIDTLKNEILNVCSVKSSDFEWNNKAQRIKASCKRLEHVSTFSELLSSIQQIKNNEIENVLEIDKELQKLVDRFDLNVYNKIKDFKDKNNELESLFTKWKSDSGNNYDSEEFEDDDEAKYVKLDFKSEFFSKLRPLIRKISIKQFDGIDVELTHKEEEFYNIVEPIISKEIDDENRLVLKAYNDIKEAEPDNHDIMLEKTIYQKIGGLAYFITYFGGVCRGLESVIFNKLPSIYKTFRVSLVNSNTDIYDRKLLEKILSKNKGKRLHPDELDMLVGFINYWLCYIAQKNNSVFNNLKHKYVNAYKDNIKPVIGVDEATDYTILDYYLISSFSHYEYSSLTLCGDIMQGLNKFGIAKWKDLEPIIGKQIDVIELKTSYRQLPTLVDMSRSMYFDDQGVSAPFSSSKSRSDNDPKPLRFISDDEDDKAEWIAKRIHDVYLSYDKHMPSVAIFLDPNDKKNSPKEFISRLEEYDDELNGIIIEDCTDNRQAEGSDLVRVFYINEVKGMEFEVAFFHNIDKAFANADTKLMRRYLYVGVSRATTHLAATFTEEEGNEDILKYFDQEVNSWLI